jgi:hypothetical protein
MTVATVARLVELRPGHHVLIMADDAQVKGHVVGVTERHLVAVTDDQRIVVVDLIGRAVTVV